MALDVIDLQADWIIASGYIGIVGVGEIAHQAVVVKFEIIVLKFFSKTTLAPLGVSMIRLTSSMSSLPKASRTSTENCISRNPDDGSGTTQTSEHRSSYNRMQRCAVDSDAGSRQGVGHDLKARISTGALHLPKGDVHGAIATSSAYAACAPSAGDLSIDSDFQLLALGDHEPVGTCVKFYLDDGPVAATIG